MCRWHRLHLLSLEADAGLWGCAPQNIHFYVSQQKQWVRGQNVPATIVAMVILSYSYLHSSLVLVTKLVQINEWVTGSLAFISELKEAGWFGPDIAARLWLKVDKFLGKPHFPLKGRIKLFMDPHCLCGFSSSNLTGKLGFSQSASLLTFPSVQFLMFSVMLGPRCAMCHQVPQPPVPWSIMMSPSLSAEVIGTFVWNERCFIHGAPITGH